jgi:hypothetical protein
MKMAKNKKFRLTEKEAKKSPVKDIEWEGEEIGVESTTKLEEDKGTGDNVILRFFQFAINPETFKQHTPTAQELFTTHAKGIEVMLWKDGMSPYYGVEPRLIMAKDNQSYTFAITCVPALGQALLDKSKTLSELVK